MFQSTQEMKTGQASLSSVNICDCGTIFDTMRESKEYEAPFTSIIDALI